MRKLLLVGLIGLLVNPAFAVDRWHRDDQGGQDLTDEKGVIVAMVRHQDNGQWMAMVGKSRGSEEWVVLGRYRLMAEAKHAAQARMHVDSE